MKRKDNGSEFLLLWFGGYVISASFVTPWTLAHQDPLSKGLPRQEYWSGLPFPSPKDLPDPVIKPISPALGGGLFITEPPRKPESEFRYFYFWIPPLERLK